VNVSSRSLKTVHDAFIVPVDRKLPRALAARPESGNASHWSWPWHWKSSIC